MSKTKNNSTEEKIELIEESLSKTEQFIETHYKSFLYVLGGIAIVVGLFFGYKYLILAPKEKEAEKQIYQAQQFFDRDSFKLALNGDGNAFGFKQIIDNYGSTKTGNLAKFYAGFCNLHLGNFQAAIDLLKSYDGNDMMLGAKALTGVGDAYVEMNKLDDGAKYYRKAAEANDNEFTAPTALMKAGGVYEAQGKYNDALEVYNIIKDKYGKTAEARDIDKYIARATLKSAK
jgi:Uncharacterized protein conserved in bacteria